LQGLECFGAQFDKDSDILLQIAWPLVFLFERIAVGGSCPDNIVGSNSEALDEILGSTREVFEHFEKSSATYHKVLRLFGDHCVRLVDDRPIEDWTGVCGWF
jgi:hypothetical protein